MELLLNLLDPTVLFFFLGLLIVSLKSNLELPSALVKGFSLYLLLAIGYKGGIALAASGLSGTALIAILLAMGLSFAVPIWSYFILKKFQPPHEAAAIAATYGSVSAVTFIAATNFLANAGVAFGGYMIAALALMESPAIIMALFLVNMIRKKTSYSTVLKEAFTDGNHLVLVGSLVIGVIAGLASPGFPLQTFVTGDLFKGILAFFLLEMGLKVGRQLKGVSLKGLSVFAIIMPVLHATLAIILGALTGLPLGDTVLLSVLAASASYIVVPAVLKSALPEASPAKYFTMSIAITFPFNLIVGIPLYFAIASMVI